MFKRTKAITRTLPAIRELAPHELEYVTGGANMRPGAPRPNHPILSTGTLDTVQKSSARTN